MAAPLQRFNASTLQRASSADRLTAARRSWNMSRITGKNTKPEMIVRSMLHKMGYRFRLHDRKLPGCPDIVLPKLLIWKIYRRNKLFCQTHCI